MKQYKGNDRPEVHKRMVNKRHSEAYKKANALLIKQVSGSKDYSYACSCGNSSMRGIGHDGKIDVYCDECNTLILEKDMSHEKYGDNMTIVQKQNLRLGLCEYCGHDLYSGKLYLTKKGTYIYQYFCFRCQHSYIFTMKKPVQKNKKNRIDKIEG